MTVAVQGSPMMTGGAETLEKSRRYCRDLTKRAARNFYYGLRLLREPKRSAMYALYAYMRLVDDIADDDAGGRTLAQRQGDLEQWEALTHQAMEAAEGHGEMPRSHIVWPAFGEMVHGYRVPAKVFADMIAGQRQDLSPVTFATFDALREYCYRVASVVGMASLYVWGFTGGEETLKYGVDRGVAFQLTNILRDLKEDARRGRCYLPAEDLERFGVSVREIAAGQGGRGFVDLMRFQIERAEGFYDRSSALDERVEADARPTLRAMTGIYRGLLRKIAADPTRVLRERVRLSSFTKLGIGWRALWGRP